MFTVRNTLFGAVANLALVLLAGWVKWIPAEAAPLAAIGHVWFLLGHLHLRREAREGRPGVWPVVRSS